LWVTINIAAIDDLGAALESALGFDPVPERLR
jgi:hypothetical protein